MRNSRSSIRLINTRGSRQKQVFTPLVFALKPGNEVVFLKILQELLAHTQLDVFGRLQALLLERLSIRWDVNSPHLASDLDGRLIDPPFGNKAIRVEPRVQLTIHSPIVIDVIAAHDD